MELPALTRLLGMSLPFHVDDWGRGSARPALVKANLFPLDETFTLELIEFQLMELEDAGYLTLYLASDGRQLLELTVWAKVDRPKDSDFPPPPKQPKQHTLLAPLEDISPCRARSRDLRETFAKPSRDLREDYAVVERESLRESVCEREGESESEPERVVSSECGVSGESVPGESRESESVSGSVGGLVPPSPFCRKHQPYGTEESCGGCLRARIRQQGWLKDHPEYSMV